jgi:hypothetical protein
MEPVSSLPCSQQPDRETYLDVDKSSPYHSIIFLDDQFEYY